MDLTNVNRYVAEPVDYIHLVDINTGMLFRTMGHRVRDLETQETTPGLMTLDDAIRLVLHMDTADHDLPIELEDEEF